MSNKYIAFGLFLFLLFTYAGCTNGQNDDQIATCNSAMRGTVSLTMTGNPSDSFRVSLVCGSQLITQCTATVAAGQTTANCSDPGPNPVPNSGRISCSVGPGNNNSAGAVIRTFGCG